ncbi:hypothetical protein MBEBAB_2014 [Brevundimonas abyssalis TAR-001]|uniref:Uncharacterized protein n=1 Tax=Brevundimonas abyssalis TAR-001 TaxID=1391729 RepID=A0A8E0NCF6_9CAUL|nr:hypothetical protein [Brevundimonas abyssalis]GAD59764.1 hypothetical protein MBEBAB_2014 [Brevundimonas abyssalis TAR-001]
MRRLTLAAALLALTAPAALAQTPDAPARGSAAAPVHAEDAVLADIIASDTRAAANTARDQHRRPYEALTFWGLRPGLTVVEIEPGARAGGRKSWPPTPSAPAASTWPPGSTWKRPPSRTAPAKPAPGWSRNWPPSVAPPAP